MQDRLADVEADREKLRHRCQSQREELGRLHHPDKRRSREGGLVPLASICTDGGTQPRAEIDAATVEGYAEALADGVEFPPVVVFRDRDGTLWLADGFHRLEAHRRAGREAINAIARTGALRDAVLYSVGANAEHGLPRGNADKWRAVETLLRDDEWKTWSDREIGRRCRVSQPFVGRVRASLSTVDSEDDPDGAETPDPPPASPTSLITVISESDPDEAETPDSPPAPTVRPAAQPSGQGERKYTSRHGTAATMRTSNIGRRSEQTAARQEQQAPTAVAPLVPAFDVEAATRRLRGAVFGDLADWPRDRHATFAAVLRQLADEIEQPGEGRRGGGRKRKGG